MSRPLRIQYEGAWYHVMNRGAGKRKIFHNQEQRELFLSLLVDLHNRFQVEIHSYCLMNNHYHLLIRTKRANLSRAMRHLDGIYTQRYNVIMQTDGPLFRGRFKSILIEADNYLLRLSRYIHLNPVAGNLVKKPEHYLWSSYKAYLNVKIAPYWLNTDATLSRFGRKNQRCLYRLFVEEKYDKKLDSIFKKIKKAPVLGTDAFKKSISEKYLANNRISSEICEQKYLYTKDSINIKDVITTVAIYYKIDVSALQSVNNSPGNHPRSIAIYLAYEMTDKNIKTVAQHFQKISYSGVSKTARRVKERALADKQLKQEILELKKRLSVVKT